MDRFALTDKVAIITGASEGLGAAFAKALGGAGATVVLAARREPLLRAVADSIDGALAVTCDVTAEADRRRLVDTALAAHGRLDILVNNAGIAWAGPALDERPEDSARVLDTNLHAVLHLCRLAGAHMVKRRTGAIVNIASVSALRSFDRFGLAAYAASKAGVLGLTRELAAQWGRDGVRVNAIAPGWFPGATNGYLRNPALAEWICTHTALGRPGHPDELSDALIFLASDASAYITGQTLSVDGGWTVF
jgi:NAD(P)-dependent dehydrogenase (short-subunit alcohol dehydrogenase family)